MDPWDRLGDGEMDPVVDGVRDGLVVTVTDGVALAETVTDAVTDPVGLPDTVPRTDGVLETVPLPDGVMEGDGLVDAVPDGLPVRLRDGVGDAEAVALGNIVTIVKAHVAATADMGLWVSTTSSSRVHSSTPDLVLPTDSVAPCQWW